MKRFFPHFAVLAVFLACAGEARAHGVHVSAFVNGDAVRVECSYSQTRKVENGKLEITDMETGDVIHRGTTDGNGVFAFRPSDAFLATGHGLNIRLLTGDGHGGDCQIGPEELSALSRKPGGERASSLSGVDAAELEAVVGRVVEEKLAPVREALARQRGGEPGWREIIGGLGWIAGFLGLIAYWKFRR